MPLVTIQLGQCGNQLGCSFFHTLGQAFSSHDYGASAVSEFFRPAGAQERRGGKPMVARALLVDMEPKVVDAAYASTRSGGGNSSGGVSSSPDAGWWWTYAPQNRLCQQGGSGNNWAQGFHGFGPTMEEPLMELLRKEVEHCDCLSGFLLVQSSAGGTGAGFGTYAAQTIRDAYPEAHMLSCCVWPYESGEVVVQPYNTLLTLSSLTGSADGVILLENEQLHRLCQKVYDIANPSFSDMNDAAAKALAGMLLPSRCRSVAGPASGSGTNASGSRPTDDVSKRLANMHVRNPRGTDALSSKALQGLSQIHSSDAFDFGFDAGELSSFSSAAEHICSGGGACSLSDLLGHLCCHPRMRLLTMRAVPQLPPASVQFTTFAWPAILKRLRQMLLTGSVIEAGMDWAVDLGSVQRRVPPHPLDPPFAAASAGTPPPERNVSLADWLVLRGQGAGSADVAELADPRLHATYSVDPLRVSSCAAEFGGYRMAAAMLSNDQRCLAPMQRMQESAYTMLASKAFVHQYEKYGMTLEDFHACFNTVEETLERYRLLG